MRCRAWVCLSLLVVHGCGDDDAESIRDAGADTGSVIDAGMDGGEAGDAGQLDAGPPDAGPPDGGFGETVVTVTSCDAVTVSESAGLPGPWIVSGEPLVIPEETEIGVRVTAPAVAWPTRLELANEAGDRFGIRVEPGAAVAGWPRGMALDCGPFRYGVASGDPTSDSVVLWTHRAPDDGEGVVTWELSSTPGFEGHDVLRGVVLPDAASDFTVHVEVDGLAADTTYYYRFLDTEGRSSRLGRTRTTPATGVDQARFAVASCSSLYSGYFNAYRRIAERQDLDLVIHVGDYIYDFVDEQEQVRVPDPAPVLPDTLETWRARHAFYLGDPDLRAARAMHPWVVMWDNHDVSWQADDFGGGVQAFREWVPMRQPEEEHPEIGYRVIAYGDLVDLVIIDGLLFRDRDLLPGTDAPSMLGTTQAAWLEERLVGSTATWRFVGTQKLFAPLRAVAGLAAGTWGGFPESRAQVLDLIARESIENLVFLSGDAHITVVADLPRDPDEGYDPTTGEGSLAVEFLPAGISRGNVDETLGDGPATPRLIAGLLEAFYTENPHYAFTDLVRHGYGILDVTPARVQAEVWYAPILRHAYEEELGVRLEVHAGDPHWRPAP